MVVKVAKQLSFRIKVWYILTIQMGVPKIGIPQNGWFIMENPIKMG